jgi:excisionase family DNA binding protein
MKTRKTTEPKEGRSALAIDLEELRGRHTCSIEEAAALLGIGRSTAYAAAGDGSLPVLKVSHRLLVSVSRLLALLGYTE